MSAVNPNSAVRVVYSSDDMLISLLAFLSGNELCAMRPCSKRIVFITSAAAAWRNKSLTVSAAMMQRPPFVQWIRERKTAAERVYRRTCRLSADDTFYVQSAVLATFCAREAVSDAAAVQPLLTSGLQHCRSLVIAGYHRSYSRESAELLSFFITLLLLQMPSLSSISTCVDLITAATASVIRQRPIAELRLRQNFDFDGSSQQDADVLLTLLPVHNTLQLLYCDSHFTVELTLLQALARQTQLHTLLLHAACSADLPTRDSLPNVHTLSIYACSTQFLQLQLPLLQHITLAEIRNAFGAAVVTLPLVTSLALMLPRIDNSGSDVALVAGVTALAAVFTGVRILNIKDTPMTVRGVQLLLQSSFGQQLETLIIDRPRQYQCSDNSTSAAAVRTMAVSAAALRAHYHRS